MATLLLFLTLLAPHQNTDPSDFLKEFYEVYEGMSDIDRFLDFYHPDLLFEDPTAQQKLNKTQLSANYRKWTNQGLFKALKWNIMRTETCGKYLMIEGSRSNVRPNGVAFDKRFVTLLKLKDGKIIHQIDYMVY